MEALEVDDALRTELQQILATSGRLSLLAHLRTMGVSKRSQTSVANLVCRSSAQSESTLPALAEAAPAGASAAAPKHPKYTCAAYADACAIPSQQLHSLMAELVTAYQQPTFQSTFLATLQADAAATNTIVRAAQAPVLARHGFSADEAGLDAFRAIVHRRIAEGDRRVLALANEGRRLLRMKPISAPPASAEGLLQGLAQKHQREAGSTEQRARMRRAVATGELLPPELTELLLRDAGALCIDSVVLALVTMASQVPLAALVGRPASPCPLDFATPPAPAILFERCVLESRPAVLRGAADEANFPPLRLFADYEYVRRRCGHRHVPYRSYGASDADGRRHFVTKSETCLPLSAFLDAVEACEADGGDMPFYVGGVPLATEVPELSEDVLAAPFRLPELYGECFGPLIETGAYTYWGAGRNVTTLHYDTYENLLLCVTGTKRLWLYPPSDTPFLYPIVAGDTVSRSAAPCFKRFEELPSELQATYPLFARARPIEVNLAPGDVLYLPACMWHCVEGSCERNMILSWWFARHEGKRPAQAVPTC